jgi:hypothetical protein
MIGGVGGPLASAFSFRKSRPHANQDPRLPLLLQALYISARKGNGKTNVMEATDEFLTRFAQIMR